MTAPADAGRSRHLCYLSRPALWPVWPFLPLVRRRPGCDDECGLLYDGFTLTGRSATVHLCNLFELPPTEAAFLALPQEAYDTVEEVYAGGWRID